MRVILQALLFSSLLVPAGALHAQEAPERQAEPQAEMQAEPEVENTLRTGSGETRIVRNGETLMSISREWSTRSGTSLAQTMISIYRTNPEAFGRSMSDMQRGATLRLPTPEAIRAVPETEATAEVGRELGIWRTQNAPRLRLVAPTETIVDETPAAPPVAAPLPATVSPTPRVTARTPRESAPAVVAPAAQDPIIASAAIEALEQRLLVIEQQLAESRQLLEQRGEELRALQQKSAQRASWQATLASLWWLSPIFIVLTLVLSITLWWRGRRAPEPVAEIQPASEMGFDRSEPEFGPRGAAVKPAAAREPAPLRESVPLREPVPEIKDVLLQPAAPSLDPLDLEGDPPPLNEASSMIDLARAYIEMGDYNAALAELQSALKSGDEAQRIEALRLLDSLPKS